jgi:hypothetical protein
VPLGTLIPDGGLAVLLRLPASITLYTQSFTQGIFRVGFRARSAVLNFVCRHCKTAKVCCTLHQQQRCPGTTALHFRAAI